MQKPLLFLTYLVENRYLIFQLTKRDVISRYKRAHLGIFWALAEPLAFMSVLYLVFGIGLRGGRSMEMPFICYLITGMAVVNFFGEATNKGTDAVRSHSYLLKKINFRFSVLPVVTVLASIIDHFLLLTAVLVILVLNGISPHWYWFQTFYYLFSLSVLLLGITWFTSSVGVFFPDLQNIVKVFNRMLFYFTPVMWSFDLIPERLKVFVKMNPLFYIAMGYRESFFYRIPFWQHPLQTLYFWGWVGGMLGIGIFTFTRLRPQFADYV